MSKERFCCKQVLGAGLKREPWVNWLYHEINEHFNAYQKCGVEFSPKLLRRITIDIIEASTHPDSLPGLILNGRPIAEAITVRWIQRSMEANNIVGRAHTGKLWLAQQDKRILKCQSHLIWVSWKRVSIRTR
uniref:Uncharacterized protein n=1 Tax=Spongospora subterranea TaxID=70186 RepID=A0A0H5QT18_9EUKA|eukprot:CRZ05168.1 hypothetical protein [Spongospora subterranea]